MSFTTKTSIVLQMKSLIGHHFRVFLSILEAKNGSFSFLLGVAVADFRFVNGRCHHWLRGLLEWPMPCLLLFRPVQGKNWF